jgi:hypothetical protein|tara:strand:- start:517 stop:768 length:252 start_codon:yes stop_codon:yes gene_type:complete
MSKAKKYIFVKKGKDGKPVLIDPKEYEGKLMGKVQNRRSGGMSSKKNYMGGGSVKKKPTMAKTGKLVGKQKNLPLHLQKKILA